MDSPFIIVLKDAFPKCRPLLAIANHKVLRDVKHTPLPSQNFCPSPPSPLMEQLQPLFLSRTPPHHPRASPLHPQLVYWSAGLPLAPRTSCGLLWALTPHAPCPAPLAPRPSPRPPSPGPRAPSPAPCSPLPDLVKPAL
jgi:hypothetical protein